MADFSLGSAGTGRVEAWENWNNSWQVSIHYKLQCEIRSGAYNTSGPTAGPYWDGSLGGGHVGSGYWTYASNGWRTLREFDVTFNKDGNGNISIGVYGHVNGKNAPYVGASQASFTLYPARIGGAPPITSITADTISVVSARLGGEIGGYGVGTSANMTMYIRKLGDASWTDLGNQGDVGGYNYWYPTGLTPATTYQYMMSAWNNNGDGGSSGVQQFTMLPAPSVNTAMLGIIGVM